MPESDVAPARKALAEFKPCKALVCQTNSLSVHRLLSPHRLIPPDDYIDPRDDEAHSADAIENPEMRTNFQAWLDQPMMDRPKRCTGQSAGSVPSTVGAVDPAVIVHADVVVPRSHPGWRGGTDVVQVAN